MELKFNAGDTIAIPEGCKAIIKDESVVFEKEFKKGDILSSGNTILIFKENHEDNISHFRSYYDITNQAGICWIPNNEDNYWVIKAFRHATEEEKQLLFKKMKEQGLKWNVEEKKVENIRWRAKKGEDYHFMNTDFTTVNTTELGDDVDTNRYDALNYFHTEEQTKEAAKRVKETLRNYHEEIKE